MSIVSQNYLAIYTTGSDVTDAALHRRRLWGLTGPKMPFAGVIGNGRLQQAINLRYAYIWDLAMETRGARSDARSDRFVRAWADPH